MIVTAFLAKDVTFSKMVNEFTKKILKFGAIFLLREAAFTFYILEREGLLRQDFYELYRKVLLESKERFSFKIYGKHSNSRCRSAQQCDCLSHSFLNSTSLEHNKSKVE